MHAFDKLALETAETDDEIRFVLERDAGWFFRTVLLIAILVFGYECFRAFQPSFLFVIAMLALWLHQTYRSEGPTFLTVTESKISSNGPEGYCALDTSAIRSIFYSTGDDSEPPGLYAIESRRYCLMPDLDMDQSHQIIDAIYRKFPDTGLGDRDGSSLLFKENGGITQLGLNE